MTLKNQILIISFYHFPIVIDPSHGVGYWDYVPSMARAAVADGLMLEVHNNPSQAFSNGGQSLKYDKFDRVMKEVRTVEGICRNMEAVYD